MQEHINHLHGTIKPPVDVTQHQDIRHPTQRPGSPLLAPIFIGCEVFGFSYLPAFFIVCAVAYLFNMDKSIYALQERT